LNRGPFYAALANATARLGGAFNAHLHLDRYGTLDEGYFATVPHRVLHSSHVSLKVKHSLIGSIHAGPAYEREDLRRRVGECLDTMVAAGTVRADTMVDVTADEVELRALDWLHEIRREWADRITLRLAAYSPFGFRDDEPQRWDVYREGARRADFLGCLPEADDTDDYPAHIGFTEHCRRVLELAQELAVPVHVHTDQRNEPTECGTERLIEAVRRYGAPRGADGEPAVWAVHMISPSTYDEARFERLVQGLLDTRIGVICCPSAALGMRQLRPLLTPTTNSIPRVLELLEAGVPVRLGSDNIADLCSPSTTADLADEVFILSAAIRYYDVDLLAHLAAGRMPDAALRARVRQHLARNDSEIRKALRGQAG
jgi:cytosine/creatinine deaminase